jgi:hypothetical protein
MIEVRVFMKYTILWNVTPCGPVEIYKCFGGTLCPHLQDRKVSQARNQQQIASQNIVLIIVTAVRSPETTWYVLINNRCH